MPISIEELLDLIPSDTQERVERAKNRFNLAIREALRQETALHLTRNDADFSPASETAQRRESQVISVRLDAGLPVSLKQREIDDAHLIATLLAPWTHTLIQLRDSTGTVVQNMAPSLREQRIEPGQLFQQIESLKTTNALAEDLLKVAQSFNLVKWILEGCRRRPRHL